MRLDPKTGKGTDIGLIRLHKFPPKAKPKTTTPKAEAEGKSKSKPKTGPKSERARHLATALPDVWGLIWDGNVLWALTPDGRIVSLDLKTAAALPSYRVPVTFWGACAMLRL